MEQGNYESIDEKRAESAPVSSKVDAMSDMPDPQAVSNEVRVEFDDIFREPQGGSASSLPQVFNISQMVYTYTTSIVYKIFSTLFSVVLSFFWGLTFAMLAFMTVWMINPGIRAFYIGINLFSGLYHTWIVLFCEPFYRACGLVFSRMSANFYFKPLPASIKEV